MYHLTYHCYEESNIGLDKPLGDAWPLHPLSKANTTRTHPRVGQVQFDGDAWTTLRLVRVEAKTYTILHHAAQLK